ncbi:MAG: TolC family protein [Candidatus Poribacteria bacterium]|nr:TolC family protein [Candidatus Poribacteria bacterium]MDE0505257.1 TolC family protein [Candidatus Poribacteria bacterium]
MKKNANVNHPYTQIALLAPLLVIIASSVRSEIIDNADAQTTLKLTLEKSITQAQKSNLNILSLEEKVKTAETLVRAARARLLPHVSVTSNYTYFKDLSRSVLEFGNGGFPTFPSVDGMGQNGRDGTEQSVIEIEFGAHHNLQSTLGLRQPIFAWGRYFYAYQGAQLDLEAARKELQSGINQLSLDVSEAFHGVLLAQEFANVAEQTVALVQEQLNMAQKKFNAGAVTNFDVLRAKVQLANTKTQLIQARNRVDVAQHAFKNLLNIDLADEILLTGNFELPELSDLKLGALIPLAKKNRPEIQQLEFSEAAGRKRLDSAKTANLPDLSLFSNYQVDDNEKLTRMNRVWNVGVQINIPIFDGLATRAAVQQAKSGLKQVKLAKDQRIDFVEFEVRTAFLNLVQAKSSIDVQKETVTQAEESMRIANLRYDNGMLTSVELTDAQLALAQAEVNHLQARHDFVVEFARLERAVGQPLR